MIFAIAAILGLLLGSFLSMLLPRLHNKESGIVGGRSHCPNCKKTLHWYELLPLISYLLQKGQCRKCKKKISAWYPFSETLSLLSFLGLAWQFPEAYDFAWRAPLVFVMLFIFLYDLRFKEIHDLIMLPGILYATLFAWQVGDLQSALIGAAIAFVFFGLQWLASRGQWLGSGDILIGLFIGLALGWPKTLLALFISYLLGSLIGIVLILKQKANGKTALPLGPFLVIGTLIAALWGSEIIDWYWAWL